MPPAATEFIETVATPLGCGYLAAAVANVVATCRAWRAGRRARAAVWLAVALGFAALGDAALAGRPLEMPESWKQAVDAACTPVALSASAVGLFVAFFLGRRFFVRPAVAWTGLNVSLVLFGASMTDPEFAANVTRPDNVPIVAMVYLVGFFIWLGAYQAVENDRRLAAGEQVAESDDAGTVLVWPDLVYVELIGAILAVALLIVWSLLVKAPLEQPANPALTPNPAKAPWYFVGLQEMLVYFDPWIAGVVLPLAIIVGLMAIPYLDRNPHGNGYYTINQRPFAHVVFQFGFLLLWIMLIVIGTFLRGPNWDLFGPYESHAAQETSTLANVTLSEYFWTDWLGRDVPNAAAGAAGWTRLATVLVREIAGIALLAAAFFVVPAVLGRTALKSVRRQLGWSRYAITSFLLILMLLLPVKMLLRWTLNLSCIVSVPEWMLNF